eukprot:TRINITY_DN11769_c0_g1_i5.p1 TRINITY_DN11769_c0_g1~~TRINITY_DN11769_c0_g1_i5.p1  ORF type:complete len:644 (-),score=85.87 TRINITY_DN11769_c0_g1_i5:138-2069(-)
MNHEREFNPELEAISSEQDDKKVFQNIPNGIMAANCHKSDILVEEKVPDAEEPKPNKSSKKLTYTRLLLKRKRWKPNGNELEYLKSCFEKNQYPTKENKEEILQQIDEKFGVKRSIIQVTRWFQHFREKQIRNGAMKTKKNGYSKFKKDDQDYLQTAFKKNPYPTKQEMVDISDKLSAPVAKVENWYKHNRRSLSKRGLFRLKNRKYFKPLELRYLEKTFAISPKPSKEKYQEIAQHLKCAVSHIKNWFSNKRKKQKRLFHRSLEKMTQKSNNNQANQGLIGHQIMPHQLTETSAEPWREKTDQPKDTFSQFTEVRPPLATNITNSNIIMQNNFSNPSMLMNINQPFFHGHSNNIIYAPPGLGFSGPNGSGPLWNGGQNGIPKMMVSQQQTMVQPQGVVTQQQGVIAPNGGIIQQQSMMGPNGGLMAQQGMITEDPIIGNLGAHTNHWNGLPSSHQVIGNPFLPSDPTPKYGNGINFQPNGASQMYHPPPPPYSAPRNGVPMDHRVQHAHFPPMNGVHAAHKPPEHLFGVIGPEMHGQRFANGLSGGNQAMVPHLFTGRCFPMWLTHLGGRPPIPQLRPLVANGTRPSYMDLKNGDIRRDPYQSMSNMLLSSGEMPSMALMSGIGSSSRVLFEDPENEELKRN